MKLAIPLPDPHLPEKDGAGAFQPDRNGDKKKKRRVLDEEEEETSFSVIREQMKLQIMSPEQIRAEVLRKFLGGEQATCPVGCGGIAEIVRVGTLDDFAIQLQHQA